MIARAAASVIHRSITRTSTPAPRNGSALAIVPSALSGAGIFVPTASIPEASSPTMSGVTQSMTDLAAGTRASIPAENFRQIPPHSGHLPPRGSPTRSYPQSAQTGSVRSTLIRSLQTSAEQASSSTAPMTQSAKNAMTIGPVYRPRAGPVRKIPSSQARDERVC